jgi:hypothetical protein
MLSGSCWENLIRARSRRYSRECHHEGPLDTNLWHAQMSYDLLHSPASGVAAAISFRLGFCEWTPKPLGGLHSDFAERTARSIKLRNHVLRTCADGKVYFWSIAKSRLIHANLPKQMQIG